MSQNSVAWVDDPMRFSEPTSLEVSTARAWLSAYAARRDLHHHIESELLSMAYVVAAFNHWQKHCAEVALALSEFPGEPETP